MGVKANFSWRQSSRLGNFQTIHMIFKDTSKGYSWPFQRIGQKDGSELQLPYMAYVWQKSLNRVIILQ